MDDDDVLTIVDAGVLSGVWHGKEDEFSLILARKASGDANEKIIGVVKIGELSLQAASSLGVAILVRTLCAALFRVPVKSGELDILRI